MSLVHPIIEPQIALRACKGQFFGTQEEWIALLYSNRIVFTPAAKIGRRNAPQPAPATSKDDEQCDESSEEVVISIPQPPMTMGDPQQEILPNIGGAFFALGRSRDKLALQYSTSLIILSINTVNQTLELQGIWGLPKTKEIGLHRPNLVHHRSHSRVPSAASLVSLAEQASLKDGPTHSSHSSTSSLVKPNLSPSSSGTQGSGRSGLALSPHYPPPKPSPDGTNIFVATKTKYHDAVLLILSAYGKETVRFDTDYLSILTLGWITDDLVYFVYLNSRFHKKFQVCRLTHKARSSGLFGMGKKSLKPSFTMEVTIPIALDYLPSTPDTLAGPDLVFKDCVMLGTRNGGYIRVNYKAGAWENVMNAKNVVGAVSLGDTALIVQTKGRVTSSSPALASQFTFSVVSDGTVHALRAQPEIGACLSSKHNIDGDRRFIVKLIHLGDGLLLDYKRKPFRMYKYRSHPTSRISLVDEHSVPPEATSKLVKDFLIKTEQALYTRDSNGDDDRILKILDRETQLSIPLERPALFTVERRDIKSLYAAFTSLGNQLSPEIVILDESQTKFTKLKAKANFSFAREFDGQFARWHVFQLRQLHRNVVLVTLTSTKADADQRPALFGGEENNFEYEWVIVLISFVGATSKRDFVPPKGHILMKSKTPEVPPHAFAYPGNNDLFTFHVYNKYFGEFTKRMSLTVNILGEYKLNMSVEKLAPVTLDQSDGVTMFTDYRGPMDGYFMAGTVQPSNRITNVLAVEAAPHVVDSKVVVLSGSDPFKTTIWAFNSPGCVFREYSVRDVPPEKLGHQQLHEQMIKTHQQKHAGLKNLEVSPDFSRKTFAEVSANNDFRPLPELPALVARGIGYGLDAEIYIKTPDDGLYAMFRIQNKRLHESLAKLERTILEHRVGLWLSDELREQWVEQCQNSSMIAGSAFGAYWQLNEEQQQELCATAGVDSELIKKMRPP